MEASKDRCSFICVDFPLKSIDEWTHLFYIVIEDCGSTIL